ncbi:hypothetical protein EDEG_02114 [Edhazardia aedis USNM 41457]|uniref:Ubiquitin-conjugating enzyme E2 H n=1 Tax=Edhazardia aedis (strain USNM 41457) TaxID=1003232 RepID=J9DLV8_EDHAE|nr:hypothetical protein EDEG_02114 [Edhazardia aedis USNM 41457]|eukprot:EJW03560.1 hypothetical protein EDEG_02114 [Edhazardia aedis USNM 41457]
MPTKNRIMSEVQKLIQIGFKVKILDDMCKQLQIIIPGPIDSPYENGNFLVNITVPSEYPFKSPSIGFGSKMFHPNIDESSGSICLDVLNQVWSPMYDLVNVCDIFLPQLLLYPNASDPLNGEAASLFLNDKEKYNNTVKEYVKKYSVAVKLEEETKEDSEIDSEDLDL